MLYIYAIICSILLIKEYHIDVFFLVALKQKRLSYNSSSDIHLLLSVAPVENVVIEVLTDITVRVSWDRVGDITDYVVYYRQTNNIQRPDQEMSKMVSSSEKSVIIDGLVSGATYVFQVVARVTVGDKSVSGKRIESSLPIITASLMTPTQNECPVQSHGQCKLKYYVTI